MRLDGPVRLPHPGAAERAFVIAPWAFIEPEAVREFLAAAGGAAPALGSEGADSPGDASSDLPADLSAVTGGLRPGPAWPAAAARFVRRLGELPAPHETTAGGPR